MMSRRRFIGTTLGVGVTLAMQACRPMGDRSARKRMIVDSQVHLWKAETPDRPWVPGVAPQLPEPFTIEKLVPMMDEAGVDRVVVVPPSWEGDRIDYGLEAAKKYPDRFAVMGRIPLNKPESAALLPRWREQPGMLGVRLTFIRDMADWLRDGTADWFWPAAERAGLPVMFLTTGTLPLFAAIAERHPQLTLIIDHMGISTEVWRDKKAEIPTVIDQAVALAKYPNVSIKMSAAPNMSHETYPFRDMTEYLRRVFDAYGPQRCYWGTDMTNGFARASYHQRITHFTEELDFLSEDDKDWIMGRAILQRLNWS